MIPKYVRCIHSLESPATSKIIIGKIYKLVDTTSDGYTIIDETGIPQDAYNINLFEFINPLEAQLRFAKERLDNG